MGENGNLFDGLDATVEEVVADGEVSTGKEASKEASRKLMNDILKEAKTLLQREIQSDITIPERAGQYSDDVEVAYVMFFGESGSPVLKRDAQGNPIMTKNKNGEDTRALDQQGKTVGYGFKNISGDNGRPAVTFEVQKTIYHKAEDDEGRTIFKSEVTMVPFGPGDVIYLTRADAGRFACRIEFNMQFSNAIMLSKAKPELVKAVADGKKKPEEMFNFFQVRFNRSKDGDEELGVNDPTRRQSVGEIDSENSKGNKVYVVKKEWEKDFGGAYLCYKAPGKRGRSSSKSSADTFADSRPNALAAYFRRLAAQSTNAQA